MNRCVSSRNYLPALLLATLAATAASAQTTPTGQPAPTGQQQGPESAPTKSQPPAPEVRPVTVGPTRELKLAENTWMRFGFQVQAWYKAAQDRTNPTTGSEPGYAQDFFCRRCRLFASGSVVKDVTFLMLFEVANFGKADATTGVKNFATASVLDAWAQVKFANEFYLSAGSIVLPLNRNATQPTTTYLSIDIGNSATSPIAQGNTNVVRDLGVLANGFLLADHFEYRVGLFQGTRAAALTIPAPAGAPAGTPATVVQSGSHNPFRFVAALQGNLWDSEKGYVNGGHYYGTKKVLGAVASFDYQAARTQDAPSPGVSKGAYTGVSGAVFINYPLNGVSKTGGDEIVGLLQGGLYDGGAGVPPAATSPGTYSAVLKQFDFLAEGAYYNHAAKMSVFGKYEMRTISSDYPAATKSGGNITWIAGGLKYYVAPANLLNFGVQYERIIFPDALAGLQSGTNNVTVQMQMVLY